MLSLLVSTSVYNLQAIMEDTADRQQAIHSIKSSADDLITKVKSKEHEGLPEEERIKIDGMCKRLRTDQEHLTDAS